MAIFPGECYFLEGEVAVRKVGDAVLLMPKSMNESSCKKPWFFGDFMKKETKEYFQKSREDL